MQADAISLVAVVLIIAFAGVAAARFLVYRKAEHFIAAGDGEALVRLVDGAVCRLVFPRFDRLLLKFNGAVLTDERDAAAQALCELLGSRTTAARHADVVMRGLSFYLETEDDERARALMDEIEGWGGKLEGAKREARRLYDIVAKGSSRYLKEMEAELARASGEERAQLIYLLALQCKNRGDERGRARYLKMLEGAS